MLVARRLLPGKPVTAGAISRPTLRDWIGLFKVGDASTGTRHWWGYTNNIANGQASLTAPATAGTYEFRYFANNTYTLLGTSTTVARRVISGAL